MYIPLLVEDESTEIMGILPIVKKKGLLSTTLVSLPEGAFGGYVVKKDLTDSEKNNTISLLLQYIDKNFSKGCSTFTLNENLLETTKNEVSPIEILIKNGFTYNFNKTTQLPCTYLLELKQPFENFIWNEQWGHRLKNKINKSKKMGIVVKEDKDLQYSEDFFSMLHSTNKRLNSYLPSKNEVVERLKKFNEKTKLFVAFLGEEPLAAILCYYQSSICYLSKLPSYEKARGYDANTLLASEAIRDACEKGYRYCEFGVTDFPAQTRWKEQFKGVKIPLRIYEKRYSNIRTILEKNVSMVKWALAHKRYIWNNRRGIINKIVQR
ncbi:MAG: GNAT family N-acetyltransferase [Promethearchaeota archaeon]